MTLEEKEKINIFDSMENSTKTLKWIQYQFYVNSHSIKKCAISNYFYEVNYIDFQNLTDSKNKKHTNKKRPEDQFHLQILILNSKNKTVATKWKIKAYW